MGLTQVRPNDSACGHDPGHVPAQACSWLHHCPRLSISYYSMHAWCSAINFILAIASYMHSILLEISVTDTELARPRIVRMSLLIGFQLSSYR